MMALSLRRAMAGRRYVRDNRGRFATTGATARGGRLRTAAGNKRATQTTKLSGDKASGTIGKPKGLKPGAIKAKPQASSARQAATDRLKVKTQTRRAMSADRGSVVTPGQRSRLEAGKGSTRAGARPASTVAKPRTTGNTKQQVASRVERKLAATNANLSDMTRYGRGANPTTYSRQLKRSVTLQRAQSYLTTGKLPGKNNSIAAQRSMRQAKERLAAKNAARQSAAAPKPAAKPVPKSAASLQAVNARRARAAAPRTSTYLSQKLNTQSAITRSAANAIYNRQRAVSKAGGLDKSVVRNPIGIMPKTAGSVRDRAAQVREEARKRVVKGRRR